MRGALRTSRTGGLFPVCRRAPDWRTRMTGSATVPSPSLTLPAAGEPAGPAYRAPGLELQGPVAVGADAYHYRVAPFTVGLGDVLGRVVKSAGVRAVVNAIVRRTGLGVGL